MQLADEIYLQALTHNYDITWGIASVIMKKISMGYLQPTQKAIQEEILKLSSELYNLGNEEEQEIKLIWLHIQAIFKFAHQHGRLLEFTLPNEEA